MALDLELARRQLEKFLDQSRGGWMTDEAGMTALGRVSEFRWAAPAGLRPVPRGAHDAVWLKAT